MTSPRDPNLNALWARAIIEELVRCGVRDVCITPGSRSTPLTLAAASHPQLRAHSHMDERAAAFFALGVALQTGRAVALVCTSGSAGAHYLPAAIEANTARVPLVMLTADRPLELMDCGAGQTIKQKNLFGDHVRLAEHLELPDAAPMALRHLRITIDRAMRAALGRVGAAAPGPVHLNVPFREPLEPTVVPGAVDPALYTDAPLAALGRADAPLLTLHRQAPAPDEAMARQVADALRAAARPLVVCGPMPHTAQAREGIIALARAANAPLLADPVSQLRDGSDAAHVMHRYDTWLRSPAAREVLAPDLIVRFGASPTSKVYRFWRETHPETTVVLVDAHGELFDFTQQATTLLAEDPGPFAARVAALLDDHTPSADAQAWHDTIAHMEAVADAAITDTLASADPATPWEGPAAHALHQLATARPDTTLFVASSMPIRDLDTFSGASASRVRWMANRGANGIDGLISTALGAAVHAPGPTLALIGDVAFLHDISGLMAALRCRRHDGRPLDVTFAVINNGGGGIFSYLPIAQYPEHFSEHFLTEHTVDLGAIIRAYGVPHERVTTLGAFTDALRADSAGVRVVELITDREHNVAQHRALWQDANTRVAAALHTETTS